MLNALLERSSWIIVKFGMPLVYFYHLIISSVFFNTAAEDARGLERLANTALAPMQYFFEGKMAIRDEDNTYRLERRFGYDSHFFVKTASATTLLPISITLGGTLKALAYLDPKTKERAEKIYAAVHCTKVELNNDHYASLGMEINDFKEAEFIEEPKWKRHPDHVNPLAADVEALKEIVHLLHKHDIPFWIDCGSCLGAYQYGGAIPADWDIDIAVLLPDFDNVKNALQELDPKKCVVQDWSSRAFPKSYLKVYVCESGGMIDLYHFKVYEEEKQVATFLNNEFNTFPPKVWTLAKTRYPKPMPFSNVFPLKKALFEGVEVPVPGQIEKYLQVFYGTNLAPARVYNEISGNYEADMSHPYWQLPNAH